MPETICPFLELNALMALAHLRFSVKQMIDGSYSGRHRSHQQGGGGEFVDFREYTAGEDLRRLDWKVLGRTGRPYVRLYQDETNLLCTACVDASGSMGFSGFGNRRQRGRGGADLSGADQSKLDFVKYFSAALAYLISAQQDQIGLAVLGQGLQDYLPPGSTSEHLAAFYAAIERCGPAGSSGLATGLQELFTRATRRGVLLLLSDFLVDDLEEVFAAVKLFRHRHWEVVIMHVIHPDEEELPAGTAYRFVGMEGEGTMDCTPADVQAVYRERFDAHLRAVRSLALAGGCAYRRVSTGDGYLAALGGFLVERAG